MSSFVVFIKLERLHCH